MTSLLVAVVTGLALLSGAAVLVGSGRPLPAVRVLLDLLTAAGVLRLASGRSWDALAVAVFIILLRQLVWASLSNASPWPRRQSSAPLRDRRSPPTVGGRGEAGESGRVTR
ncbi:MULTISPECIES: hypothetical protein [Micromonospora]|uniref:DUF1622 domain-containing protein n=1 Tax=Micromonospora avicenniae TaxID=1198245 RepID=A0A1N7D3U1_9ACTN|nr:hypothetical protein [Micromonospora avicenniae]SIR70558.1 hypothetical protein SAMN05444858_1158 [Micromonospora avicenniae]